MTKKGGGDSSYTAAKLGYNYNFGWSDKKD